MKLHPRVLAATLLIPLGACNMAKNWTELRTGPMPIAQVYDNVEFVATSDGFRPSPPDCDRGLGIWQSRWRRRAQQDGRPGRTRLRVEIESLDPQGWLVRWYVEQQRVKDLDKAQTPREDDWSSNGQDGEREHLFGARLSRRLQPLDSAADSGTAR